MLMKNYAWRSLIKYLTGLAFIQARRVIALTYRRRTEESVAILKAFAWNLRNLKHVWKERRRVQKQLRRMDDRHIQQRMVESVIKMPTYLLRPASPRK